MMYRIGKGKRDVVLLTEKETKNIPSCKIEKLYL